MTSILVIKLCYMTHFYYVIWRSFTLKFRSAVFWFVAVTWQHLPNGANPASKMVFQYKAENKSWPGIDFMNTGGITRQGQDCQAWRVPAFPERPIRAGMPESLTAATRGTHPRSGDQQTEGITVGDVGAGGCDLIYGHQCRGIGRLTADFVQAASCGLHSNG